jgi:hypothetical protein
MTSIIKVDQIQNAAGGTPTAADLGINTTGTVLQVQSEVLNTSTGMASGTWLDIGLSVTLTPKSTTSKFIICPSVTGSVGYFSWGIRLVRDGSPITESINSNAGNRIAATMSHNDYNAGSGDVASSNQYQMHTLAGSFHDTTPAPDTATAITFKVQANFYHAGAINRSVEDGNNNSRHRCVSSLVVYEIAG